MSVCYDFVTICYSLRCINVANITGYNHLLKSFYILNILLSLKVLIYTQYIIHINIKSYKNYVLIMTVGF